MSPPAVNPVPPQPTSLSVVTPAAQAVQTYPKQTIWLPASVRRSPAQAGPGDGKIEQYRNGSLIATYANWSNTPDAVVPDDGSALVNPGPAALSGAGPFTRCHSMALVMPGDELIVSGYFTGDLAQPYIGQSYASAADYAAGKAMFPDHIRIIGNAGPGGIRPCIFIDGPCSDNTMGQGAVYFDECTGAIWSGIDVMAGPNMSTGKAAVYNNHASDFTFASSRVSGWKPTAVMPGGAMGIFGAGNYTGYWLVEHCELDNNGGTNGPCHNLYAAPSLTDPRFRLIGRHNYSHDAYYGHLWKSRTQQNELEANYFRGGTPVAGNTQAETYCCDIPNGGVLIARGNIFVKDASGANSNGMALTYGMEGIPTNEVDASGKPYSRALSILVESNTFVAFAESFDGIHPNFPMCFFYPAATPGSPGFVVKNAIVQRNAFVGWPETGMSFMDYRGLMAVTAGFAELNEDFTLADSARYAPTGVALQQGRETYGHLARGGGLRALTTIGAFD